MNDDVKLFLTCMLFSFIVGAYTVVLVNEGRYGCTVEFKDGNGNTHTFSGRIY